MNFRKSIIALAAGATALTSGAVPARPGLITVTQSDGSELRIRLVGDESHHVCLTEDGYYLTESGGNYYYADVDASGLPVSSGIMASDIGYRSARANAYLNGVDMTETLGRLEQTARRLKASRKLDMPQPHFARGIGNAVMKSPGYGLMPGTSFPARGKQKALVILVEFSDISMTLENPHDYFSRMLNEPGFSDYGGTGSAADYFRESSMGAFEPEFDVYGPVRLSRECAYYGGNDLHGEDLRPEQMVAEACELLDAEIDFSDYDRDGDGVVDNVFVFYAGRGEASGGGEDTIWPHSYNIEYGTGSRPEHDGVQLSRYACTNEYQRTRPDGVGTFIHEFSHVMGLPDVYATSYTGSFTAGSWSCLDYGPYNNNGCTPPLYGAFERYALGWIEPVEVDLEANATLKPIGSNMAAVMRTPKDTEFFLLENRQQTSWDKYIPGHGMLIWHIDYNESQWSANTVNNNPDHQYIDIEEADGICTDETRDGDTFPGVANVTSFTDETTPGSKSWNNNRLRKPLTEISEEGDLIKFRICGGRSDALPTTSATSATDVEDSAFTAHWEMAGDYRYVVKVYDAPDGPDGQRVPVEGYERIDAGKAAECRIEGLPADNRYYFTVAVSDGWEDSAESDEICVIVGELPLGKHKMVAYDGSECEGDSFVANWEMHEKATDYILDVYTKEEAGTQHDICDFTGGADNFPQGWTAASLSFNNTAAYSGQAPPALRLSADGKDVVSPAYGDAIKSVSFWHRGNGTDEADAIEVIAQYGDGRPDKVLRSVAVIKDKGGIVTTVDMEDSGVERVRLKYRRAGSKGSLCIDDIDVSHGVVYRNAMLEDYDGLYVGNVGSRRVAGLEPGGTYFYRVKATDGDAVSFPSDEIKVVTSGPSGVEDIESAGLSAIEYYNLQGVRVSDPEPGIYIVRRGGKVYKAVVE